MNTDVIAPFALPIVMTLAHFLWQGAALGLLALVAALVLRKRSARLRYGVHMAVLALMGLCPVLTLTWLLSTNDFAKTEFAIAASPSDESVLSDGSDGLGEATQTGAETPEVSGPAVQEVSPPAALPSSPSSSSSSSPSSSSSVISVPSVAQPSPFSGLATLQQAFRALPWQRYAPWLLAAYTIGVFLMWTRLLLALHGGQRLRRRAHPLDDTVLLAAVARFAQSLNLATIPLVAYCDRVLVPTVVGVLRPMILLPITVHTGLTPQQLELLLCHELAHIRRYDHLFNLLQAVIESFLFFHPAVLYVSRRARLEREHCCDDLVLALGGESLTYAESLLRVAESTRGLTPEALLLSAAGKPSQLSQRIHRILNVPAPRLCLTRRGIAALLLAAVVSAGAVFQVAALSADPTDQSDPSDPSDLLASPLPAPKDPAEIEKLYQTLSTEPDWWLRKLALQQIAETEHPRVDLVIAVLNGTLRPGDAPVTGLDLEVRIAAAEALGKIQDPSAIPYLASALQIGNMEIPQVLAKFPAELVMPYLVAALKEDLLRYNALATLSYLGTPEAVRLLVSHTDGENLLQNAPKELLLAEANALLATKDPVTQTLGARILGQFAGSDTPPETLLPLVDNPDAKVRKTALQALKNFKAPAATDALVRMLTTDPGFPLRAEAATALQSRGWQPASPAEEAAYQVALLNFSVAGTLGEAAVPALKIAMTSEAPSGSYPPNTVEDATRLMHEQAIRTFGTAAPPSAAMDLAAALEDGETIVRLVALEALQKLNNPDTVPLVLAQLRDPDSNVRTLAARTLGSLGDARATAPLCAALNDYEISDSSVVKALARIEDPAKFVPLADFVGNMNADIRARYLALKIVVSAQSVDVAEHLEGAAKQIPDGLQIGDGTIELRPEAETVAADIRKRVQEASSQQTSFPESPAPTLEITPEATPEVTEVTPEVTEVTPEVTEVTPEVVQAVPEAPESETAGTPAPATPQDPQPLLSQLKDPDYWLRKVAAQRLGEQMATSGGWKHLMVSSLIRALKDESSPVQVAAAAALGKSKDPAAIKHLVAGLRDDNGDVLQAMADALAQYEPGLVMDMLQLAAADEDLKLRRGAALALRGIQTPEAARVLLGMLEDMPATPISSVFERIKLALLAHPVETVKPMLLEALAGANRDAACGAAEILGEIGGEDVRQALMQTAQDPASPANYAAASALASFTDEPTTQFLITLLGATDHHLRERAATILANRGYRPGTPEELARFYVASGRLEEAVALGKAAEEPLVQILKAPPLRDKLPSWSLPDRNQQLNEQDPLRTEKRLLDSAVQYLGNLKATSAFEPLLQMLGGSDRHARFLAMEGLTQLADDRAIAPLAALLDDPDRDIRHEAAAALSSFDSPEGVEARRNALQNLDVNVRSKIVERLTKLDWEHSKDLYTLALQDDSANVRGTAVGGLAEIGPPAIAFLEEHFAALPPQTKTQVLDTVQTSPLILLGLQDPAPEVKTAAVAALKYQNEQRPRAVRPRTPTPARPDMTDHLQTPEVLNAMKASLNDATLTLRAKLDLAWLLYSANDADALAAAVAWKNGLTEADTFELNKLEDFNNFLNRMQQKQQEQAAAAEPPEAK